MGSVSGQSSSSFGSAISGAESEAALQNKAGDDSGDESAATFESGVFGVLFTVSKEKQPHWAFVAGRLFMDWIQLFLILVNPAYGWNINPSNKLWQAFSFIQLNYFMSVRGYMFFLICLYIMAVALAANLGLCIWVSNSFKNNSFNHVWPIVWLRYFSLVFYQVLDIASLTLFLMTMDCQYFSVDASAAGFNQEFPDVYCWTMPHLIHVGVAAVSISIFFVLATLFTMAEIELNPVSQNLMGMAHTKVEVWGFGIKMFMTCVSVFVTGIKWMSTMQLIAAFFLCYLYLKWLPHMHAIINHVRIGSYFSVFYASLLLVIMSYHPGLTDHQDKEIDAQRAGFTLALWIGFVPMGLVGAFMSYKRTKYYQKTIVGKFRDAPHGTKPHKIYKFSDPREVEIVGRCCRQWIDEETLDQEGVVLAERIIMAGRKQMLHQPYMTIWWSSFLIDVQGSYQSGYTELQSAKKMPNQTLLERFCVFIREQEHTQKASAASSGDSGSVDLVSYVEYQRNYKLALHLHMEALVAKRTFWETLMHHNVTFDKMARAIERIETTVRASERMYKQVLTRHSNSIKILALYVKFLQGVKQDPWSAAKWSAEVEKMQKAEEEANERAVFGDGSADQSGLQNHDNSKGIIIMGANCLVRMVNEAAASIFGYTNKAELVGKNINLIVPPPFARNHNNYVRNYIQTGNAKILNKLREFVALHKDRYVVPINVYVTKVSGVGEDSVFMGIFSAVIPEKNTATAWVLNGGTTLSCDSQFTDWLGFRHEDIHSKPFSDLVQQKHEMDEFMNKIRADKNRGSVEAVADTKSLLHSISASAKALSATQAVYSMEGLRLKHMYLDLVITVSIKVSVGGIGDTAMYVMRMTRVEDNTPTLLVSDPKGRITHVTSKLASRLGSTASKLQTGGLMHAMDLLLPPPFTRIHHQWYKDKPDIPPLWSCRSGLSTCLNAMGEEGPCVVPFSMTFKKKELLGRETVNVVQLEERSFEQMLDERRLSMTLNSRGIVTEVGESPEALFGFDVKALVGSHVSYVLDILRPSLTTGNPHPNELMADEELATKILMNMAERSYDMPGMSWRVGVTAIMDPVSLVALGPIGVAMMAKKTVPAIMLVNGYLEQPRLEGARVILPSEMQLKVELWRADLMSGVMEVDAQGNISALGMKNQPQFSPHLLLGAPLSLLTGTHVSSVFSMHGKPYLEALFTDGGLGVVKGGGRGTGPGGRGGGRGGMRNAGGQLTRRRGVGPIHHVKLQHCTDYSELDLQVQAVVKQDFGGGCSLYIMMHVGQHQTGRSDFRQWLFSSPPPALAHPKGMSRRGSALYDPAGRNSMPKDIANLMMPRPPAEPPHHQPAKHAPKEVRMAEPQHAKSDSLADHPPTPPLDGPGDPVKVPEGNKDEDRVAPGLLDEMLQEEHHLKPYAEDHLMLEEQDSPRIKSPRKAQRPGSREKGGKGRTSKPKKKPEGSMKSVKRGNTKELPDKDDGDSVDSLPTGLNDNGRERITRWMLEQQANAADPDDDGSDDESSEEEDQPEQQVAEDDEEQDTAELDEAGTAMNDYKRGKRLKRLTKVLMGPQAQSPNVRLKWVSVSVVLLLIAVDLAMFMAFLEMVKVQSMQVFDLRSSSKAVNRVMTLAIGTAALEVLMTDGGAPGVMHLGEGGTVPDIRYNLHLMEGKVLDMEEYHHGIYRGFDKLRQLPDAYDLRSTWETAALPVRQFFEGNASTYGLDTNMSLWDAGNLYIQNVRNILQNMESTYGIATNTSSNFANSTDLLFILYNGPRSIMSAYQATLDGLMQQAIEDSKHMNDIQLIILAIEGGLVGTISVIIIWYMTAKAVYRRYAVFSVFMLVPSGIIRALATVSFNLEEGEEEEAQEMNEEGGEQQGGDGTGGDAEAGAAKAKNAAASVPGIKLTMTKAQDVKDVNVNKGFFSRVMSFWRPTATNLPNSKRQLKPSWTAMMWTTWPFIFWAIFVIIINIMGYVQLSAMSEPIAISNVVQFMSIRVNRVILFSLRLASEQYFDATASFTAPRDPTLLAKLKSHYKETLTADYEHLRLEYEAMLYGNSAAEVANQTSPHFTLAVKGIMFTTGSSLMFQETGCLAQDITDCQPKTSDFYRFTIYGLDQMLKHFFYNVEALLMSPDDLINMQSDHFRYIYEVGMADIYGGLILLTDVYSHAVLEAYNAALTVHIVAFVMCCALGLLFIVFVMRPNFKRFTNESKRVAELLANLPPEIQIEGMIIQALQMKDPSAVPVADVPPLNSLAGSGTMKLKALQGSASHGEDSGNRVAWGSAGGEGIKSVKMV